MKTDLEYRISIQQNSLGVKSEQINIELGNNRLLKIRMKELEEEVRVF